jgi:hypothetical protein
MNNLIINLVIILSPIVYIIGLFFYYHDWTGKLRKEEEEDFIYFDDGYEEE